MSIFDMIKEAESADEDATIEIPASMFLGLVDLWAACGWLIINIGDENQSKAEQAIFTIAQLYEELGDKYAK